MYKLNIDGIKWFRKVENLTFQTFIFICILDNILRAIGVYYYIVKIVDGSMYYYEYIFIIISELLPVILMVFSFVPLIIALKWYYYFEYNRIKLSIFFFFFAEISIFIFLQTSNIIDTFGIN